MGETYEAQRSYDYQSISHNTRNINISQLYKNIKMAFKISKKQWH